MLALSRETDYALISLAHLHGQAGRAVSAREIAAAHGLPPALVMSLLKRLSRGGVLSSTRGAQGGYAIAVDLDAVSLYDLAAIVQKPSRAKRRLRAINGEARPDGENADSVSYTPPAVQALQHRLNRFLQDVKLSDLIVPGRRIDVPLERLRLTSNGSNGGNAGATSPTERRRIASEPEHVPA